MENGKMELRPITELKGEVNIVLGSSSWTQTRLQINGNVAPHLLISAFCLQLVPTSVQKNPLLLLQAQLRVYRAHDW